MITLTTDADVPRSRSPVQDVPRSNLSLRQRTVIGNIVGKEGTQNNGEIGDDIFENLGDSEIRNNKAEDGAFQNNSGMSNYALKLFMEDRSDDRRFNTRA